jgi:exosome complex exonuclease DIS3/RRP44
VAPSQVRANGLILFVPKYGIEGPVYLTGKDAPAGADASEYTLDEAKQTVTSRDGRVRYTVFDKAAARISVEETAGHRRRLVLSLVPREELPEAEYMS